MKFRFGTKTKEDEEILVKVVADPNVDETMWLPAMEVLGKKEIVAPVAPEMDGLIKPEPKQTPLRSAFSFLGSTVTALVLIVGQVFMVAAGAVAAGTMSSALLGNSFDRVMYHCGPQDTFLGVFVLAAVPIFWTAWYLRKRRFLKYSAFCTLGFLVTYLIGGSLLPLSASLQIAASALTLALLSIFHLSGIYLSSFRAFWPRTFSVSKWLLVSYVPAIICLILELQQLDLNAAQPDRVNLESVLTTVGIIAAFAFLPAILTAVSAGTRRYGSALGLAVIGQLPFLGSMLIYCVANGIMLACFNIFGGTTLAEFFSRMAGGVFPPDFDFLPSSSGELLSKFVSCLAVLGSLCLSVAGGAYLAVLWNRFVQSRRIANKD